MEQPVLTEIPSFLKQLARLVTRGFYQIEDSLIIDMLVRNTCMKEKDIEDLLKFDLKLLRARMATLKSEKLVQIRLRMETAPDGKAQKVNYYFINYKSLVNVVKYKLDHIRKRIETQARDATNRASFKCSQCFKTFTDLEAGELYDPMSNTFICTFCRGPVEEDESAVPQKDSKVMLARFNEQLEPVFELLQKAENIRLAPALLEPEPMKSPGEDGDGADMAGRDRLTWSGEASRRTGTEETRIAVAIGNETVSKAPERKERPVWMTESTIGEYDSTALQAASTSTAEVSTTEKSSREDIMSVLLANETKKEAEAAAYAGAHDSDEPTVKEETMEQEEVEAMDSDDDDDHMVYVTSNGRRIPINEVTEEEISQMTKTEEAHYIQAYQEWYAQFGE